MKELKQDNDPNWMTIGLAAEIIINRLRNERQIREYNEKNEDPRDERNGSDQEERANLANIE